MSEDKEPDWLAELAKGGEALQRQAMQIVKATDKFAASGPARPLTRRIIRAVGASIRELAAPEPVVRFVAFADAAAATDGLEVDRTITGSLNIALPPIRVSLQGAVQEPGLIERNVGRIFALVLLAAATAGLLAVRGQDQATVGYYAGVIFGATFTHEAAPGMYSAVIRAVRPGQ
jgi:hypothetical protein